jgi:hypothetical protein
MDYVRIPGDGNYKKRSGLEGRLAWSAELEAAHEGLSYFCRRPGFNRMQVEDLDLFAVHRVKLAPGFCIFALYALI